MGQKSSTRHARGDRRTVIKGLVAGTLLPASLVRGGVVAAATLPHLDEKDPTATALGYVADVSRVDAARNPTYKTGQHCANCLQIQGKDGEAWRGCNLFPGKLVNANGWCRVWVAKPGA